RRSSVLALLLVAAPSLAAQQPDTLPPPPGAEYEISVLTAGVGAEVWERWGHDMIRVRNLATGEDVAYNWGMFSFAQPGFVRRFLMGRMHYWMEPDATDRTVRLYQWRDRTLVEQRLALTPAQRVALVAYLEWNAREENKYYRYDYYLDNCSTRLRDALDRALGGALRAQTDTVMAGTTFRRETRRLSAPDLPLYTGLMLGLGPATDRPITVWEEMFLPVKTMEALRRITVPGPDGTPVPLVASEDTLYRSRRFQEPAEAPSKAPLYLAIGGGIGLLLVWLGRLRRPRVFLVVGALVALLLGLGGALLVFLMGFTDHAVTYGNENALLVSFVALILAVSLRPALAGSRGAG
ncbi:MAG TPA: DUF4105 domain-containing protein, partial [Gemmatimonadales bacterium]|nr:DUF4105 domain-containing protein [Gemmatimonadales bacterium]